MTREAERAALAILEDAARGKPRRGTVAQGTALLRPLAKRAGSTETALADELSDHAALEVREVAAPRLLGIFRSTRKARGVGLRTPGGIAEALDAGAAAPASLPLQAHVVAALAEAEGEAGVQDLEATLQAPAHGTRSLMPMALAGVERVEASGARAGAEAARAKSDLARLRRFAPGTGYDFSARLRVNAPMAAVEALLQQGPEVLAAAIASAELERWLREDCGERELADLLTATRLRARAEQLTERQAKTLFVRLLSYSPLREAVLLGVVPQFVARLTTANEREVEEIVLALEGLGTEGVLESLLKAVYEVPTDARPRVLMALGAVGSPHVIPPLERLALHSTVKSDREEAAAAIVRIAERHPGPRAATAIQSLRMSDDAEVRATAQSAAARARGD